TNERPAGERPSRPAGERPARPAGERPARSAGERPQRSQSEAGDRPKRRPVRQEGERYVQGEKGSQENRKSDGRPHSSANRDSVDRGSRADSSGRYKEQRDRVARDSSRQGPDSGRAAGGEAQKKSGQGGGKNAAKRKKQDYDKRSKKQQNYVNLEKKTGHKKRNAVPQAPGSKDTDEIRTIVLPEYLTVRELADIMKVPASDVVKKLFMQGVMATVNQEIDYDKAEEIALEYNCIAEPEEKVDVIAELLKEDEEEDENLVTRPPVVCVMGHVDHGKTSLLDAIRNTRVTDKEAGGITQAIGASVVSINGQKITFLDTPGHEAFTAMRMRGANSTDIAILVVAADDGIMPQTIEAINHSKAAGVELIVAINKIDKAGANIDKVKQELTEYELVPEDWGGTTICVPVSAKTGEGITDLLEMILLSAEVLELKANPNRNARGLVIEAQLDKGRGPVATVLVQKGTLKVGQYMAAGSCYGRVRAMIDDEGRRVKEAGPSMPVEVLGLSSVPNAGEVFMVCNSEREAREFAETFVAQDRERLLEETRARMSLDDIFSQIQAGNLKELDLIVKADVQGSVEAVKQSLTKLSNDEVVVKVIHGGVGNINESDVSLAAASNAVIIGFNVKPDPIAKSTAEQENVDIRLYNVIYKAIEDVEAAMKGMLDPIYEERVIGHAEVRQIFKASGVGNIAGSYVTDGVIERGCGIRIFRDEEQIYEGSLASLKRFKDDAKEVKSGYECGLVFEDFNDIAEGDVVEAFKMFEIPR
ncbi:MAG: translation initiation factor IF-2, partial [Lachnospiraceae bacterium]|nr:translation initiation factor IF-2 [Lachnospiraceae bacterium]